MSSSERQSSEAEGRLRALQSELATTMMSHLIGLDQALRLYDARNSVVENLLGEIQQTAQQFGRGLGEPLGLALVESSWFANRRLVRMSFADYRKAQQLRSIWSSLDIGEMIFPLSPATAQLRSFAGQLARAARGQRGAAAPEDWGGVVVRSLRATEGAGQLERRADFTIKSYCALVVLLRHLLQALQAGEPTPLLRIRRVLQVIAESCQDHESLLLALAARLSDRPDPAAHLASVALHALIIARRLHLPRQLLLGLATAAIFHDLPKLGLPAATLAALERPEALGEAEQEQVRQRWLNALHGMLQAVGFSEETLPRLVVVYESQLEFARTRLYPQLPDAGLCLFSRIIAAANALEIYARPRPGAAPPTPHQATSALVERYGRRVGAEVLAALLQATGWYPPGCAALLESGEVGVVIGAPEGGSGEAPLLHLVRGPGGELIDGPQLLPDQAAGRALRWSLHPARLGINPVRCLV